MWVECTCVLYVMLQSVQIWKRQMKEWTEGMSEGLIILLLSAPPSCVDFPRISPVPAVSCNSVQQ